MTLRALVDAGVIGPLDRHLAEQLGAICDEQTPEILALAAYVSRATRDGHSCVHLADLATHRGADALPAAVRGRSAEGRLLASKLFGGPAEATPLVVDGGRVYLRRFHEHEVSLAAALSARAADADAVDEDALSAIIAELFPASDLLDLQRVGVALSAGRRFAVITGGPGTGKTTTVVRLVAAQVALAERAGRPIPEVMLLAPTGKAAARLSESIRDQKSRLPPALVAHIPEEAATLHRALGAGGPGRWRHGEHQPLPADLVVVDEASMVDLSLMRRLVDALLPSAALVLLGDRDQLSSVEAGSVLADVCGPTRGSPYASETVDRVRRITGDRLPQGPATRPLRQAIVELQVSRRFDPNSGIGALAAPVRDGDAARARQAADLRPPPPPGRLGESLRAAVIEGYRPLLSARRPADALAALTRFRLLCAHRRGPLGVERVGALVEAALREAGMIHGDPAVFRGRPVIVTENDYAVRLYNGDTGVVMPGEDGRPMVWFADGDDGLRALSPARLPAHETVFAMSVHKSQGSEFDDVAVLLPEEGSPLLTRELVYTAITRARARVRLWGTPEALEEAVRSPAIRASGLSDRLWGSPQP
jgi:exodeoxyribonuclease V alpha subunit